jgi:hypothetical protein
MQWREWGTRHAEAQMTLSRKRPALTPSIGDMLVGRFILNSSRRPSLLEPGDSDFPAFIYSLEDIDMTYLGTQHLRPSHRLNTCVFISLRRHQYLFVPLRAITLSSPEHLATPSHPC